MTALKEFVIVRDREARKTLVIEEFDDEAKSQRRYEDLHAKYRPPRYDVSIGVAASRRDFLRGRPRYAR